MITVTLLVAAVCVPVTGRLGDLLGKRRMLLACAVPLIAGSVVCAVATSVVPMIVGRGLQGMGMGMVPLGIALLRDVVPAERLSGSIALVGASMGIGGGLGLPIASGVAQYVSWRVLFWGSAVLAVIIAALIRFLIPDVPASAKGQRFDALGALGRAYGAMPALIMRAVPLGETAAANGFNTLMRSLGTSVGAAVIGVVLAQMTTTMGGFTSASEDGFRTALVIGGGVALVSALIASVIPAARTTAADGGADDTARAPEQAAVEA